VAIENIKGDEDAYVQAFANGGMMSKTAFSIGAYLNHPDRPFDVIILGPDENYGQMLTDMDSSGEEARYARDKYEEHFGTRVIARPVVLWNPNYKFTYFGEITGIKTNGDGSIVLQTYDDLVKGDIFYRYKTPGQFSRLIQIPTVRFTKNQMPAWLVFYHELGHVKQYYEGGVTKNAADIIWTGKLKNTAAIEADNLARHEIPICKEINIPPRAHYKHMENGFQGILTAFPGRKSPALRVADTLAERKLQKTELQLLIKKPDAEKEGGGFFTKV